MYGYIYETTNLINGKKYIGKHKQLNKFVLWKETKTEHGIGFRGIFQGTKKECQEYLEKIKESKGDK